MPGSFAEPRLGCRFAFLIPDADLGGAESAPPNGSIIYLPGFLPRREKNAPATAAIVASKRKPPERPQAKLRTCRECGDAFQAKRAGGDFCSTPCRRSFHNRRQLRGGAFYDLVMASRFDRDAAETGGAWSLLCRLAAAFRAEDEAERTGRRSWDDTAKVRARNSDVIAKLVGVNIAGTRAGRRRGCR